MLSVVSLTVFVLATAWVLYVLFGYPLLLSLAARRQRPIEKHFTPRTVTVLLAVHNGERWLKDKLLSLRALDYPPEFLRILVLSDGSTDATESIAASFQPYGIECISLPKGGKAKAINAGLQLATSEIVFFTDVRQPLERQSLRELVACFADPSVGAVSGELIIRDGATLAETNVGLYWKYEKYIRTRQSRIDSVLGTTGCIYAMRLALARPLPGDCLLDDMFLPLCAFFQGYRVLLDTSARAYDQPSSLHSEFRRKVRTLAGVYQVIGYFPALLGPANRMWIHFVSHKLGRLLVPFALLAILVSTFGLPFPWNIGLAVAQAAFYGLAAWDVAVGESSRLKPVTSSARTFVVLMTASLAAGSILFRPPGSLWKTNPSGPSQSPAKE